MAWTVWSRAQSIYLSRRARADRPSFLFRERFFRRLAAPVVLVDVRLAPAVVNRRRREARFAHGQARYAHLNLAGESLALLLADVCSLPDLRLLLVHERRGHAMGCSHAKRTYLSKTDGFRCATSDEARIRMTPDEEKVRIRNK